MAVDPILTDLQQVVLSNQEVDILNYYQSFPVTCKAKVIGLDRGVMKLQVQPPGSICLEGQDQTILSSSLLPEALRARVLFFDLLTGELQLDDFAYASPHFGERMIARFQPDEETTVDIDLADRQLKGKLADISMNGIGVYAPGAGPQRGEECLLTLDLAAGPVTLPGKIQNSQPIPGGMTRLSISFTPNAPEINGVMRYIKERRAQIFVEIEEMYARAIQGKKESTSSINDEESNK